MPLPLSMTGTLARKFRCTATPHRYAKGEPWDDNGLACCERCGGLEGSLLATCPLVRMTMDEIDIAYRVYVESAKLKAPSIEEYNAEAARWNDYVLDIYNARKRS